MHLAARVVRGIVKDRKIGGGMVTKAGGLGNRMGTKRSNGRETEGISGVTYIYITHISQTKISYNMMLAV